MFSKMEPDGPALVSSLISDSSSYVAMAELYPPDSSLQALLIRKMHRAMHYTYGPFMEMWKVAELALAVRAHRPVN